MRCYIADGLEVTEDQLPGFEASVLALATDANRLRAANARQAEQIRVLRSALAKLHSCSLGPSTAVWCDALNAAAHALNLTDESPAALSTPKDPSGKESP
jgi:hypothetical protein